MKRITIALMIALMAIATVPCFGQSPSSFMLDNIKISSGKGPLNSGLNLSIDLIEVINESGYLTQDEQELTLIFDNDQGYGLWRFDQIGRLDLLATGGVFRQTPWVGPMAKMNYTSWLSTTHWVGWTAGQVENPYFGTKYMFSWQEATLDWRHFSAYYAALNYQEGRRQDIVGACAKINLGQQFQLRLGYDRDTSAAGWCTQPRRDMFTFGVKYMPLG